MCSGFVVAFDKFWNLAMVDVDETYREPLLGQALYHEKALTITRLFEKLKVQETAALSAVERKQGDKLLKSDPRSGSSQLKDQSRRSDSRHNKEKPELSEIDKSTSSREMQKPESRPKVEYGRVHTRHVNQLFIRGENVLLVNIQQD